MPTVRVTVSPVVVTIIRDYIRFIGGRAIRVDICEVSDAVRKRVIRTECRATAQALLNREQHAVVALRGPVVVLRYGTEKLPVGWPKHCQIATLVRVVRTAAGLDRCAGGTGSR